MDAFVNLPVVAEVEAKGDTKTTALTADGLQIDVRVVAPGEFGAALLYFTGSKAHNIELRQLAIDQGWTLNEYELADVETGQARRVLQSHESVSAEKYIIRARDKEMEFMGGIVTLRGGVDGIALGPEWLYFGALSGSGLYRVRLSDLRNARLPAAQLANRVERFSDKPLSDGFSRDLVGNIYITDVEHSSVFVVGPEQSLSTLIQSGEVRWPDALSFGPDGWLYLADSALPDLILKSREHIEAAGPYRIFRFQPGFEGVPGQ